MAVTVRRIKNDKTPWKVCSDLIAKLLHSARKKHFAGAGEMEKSTIST